MNEEKEKNQIIKSRLLELKEACRGAVAKAAPAENEYLPLWMHMTDTGGVMKYLAETRITENQWRILNDGVNEECKGRVADALLLLGYLHDIGKMTAVFQAMILQKIPGYTGFSARVGSYSSYTQNSYRHHSSSGMLIALGEGFPESYASIIGSHHGRFQDKKNPGSLVKLLDDFNLSHSLYGTTGSFDNKLFWKTAWKQIIKSVMAICGFSSFSELPDFSVQAQMLISGLLVEADWISSNTNYFPLIDINDTGSVDAYPERWASGLDLLDFSKPWYINLKKMDEMEFTEIFGFSPLPMQREVLKIASNCEDPGLLIIEAPMGNGKTEAALAAAEIFAGKTGAGGVYFGLPTQATANGMYPRFRQWTENQSKDGRHSIRLAHGMASFNEDYKRIPIGHSTVDDDSSDNGNVFVHEWMQNPKTGILSDFVIGTVDQSLMMALNHKHLMLKHAGMTSKVLVIDEVHAYDVYMTEFFEKMLEWLGYYQQPVILLSATLPKNKKIELVNSYMKGRTRDRKAEFSSFLKSQYGYPILTWSDGKAVFSEAVPLSDQKKRIQISGAEVSSEQDELETIYQLLNEELKDGGAGGVVVNTVQKAQTLSRYLEAKLPEKRIVTFNSRFTPGDRAAIESEVLKLAGKESERKDRDNLIVVGTQVIEQSLDVDFDYMISELAPMDLLLQRSGRLQRHNRSDRPENFKEARIDVITADEEILKSGKSPVYNSWILLQTLRNLPAVIEIPKDIPVLVGKAYEEFEPEDSEDRKLKQALENENLHKKIKAETGLIGSIVFNGRRKTRSLNGISSPNTVENYETAVHTVRDGEENLKVYLVQSQDDDSYLLMDGTEEHKLDSREPLSKQDIENLMKTRVDLPFWNDAEKKEAVAELEKETDRTFAEWRKSNLLRDALFLVLKNNKVELLGREFVYTKKLGLEKINEKKL